MLPPLRYISVRLFLLLLGVMLVVFSIHTYLNIRTTSSNLTDYVYKSAAQASDLIARSTRYSMLLNRKEDVHQTINTMGSEPGFVGINIYDKNGEIIVSTDSLTIGRKVDLRAEACIICHTSDAPLVSVPTEGRMRVYNSGDGARILGLINPIRNEPACYNAACHAHDPDQTVLGVLDVKMSLASVDRQVAAVKRQLIFSSLAMMLLIAGVSGLFIYSVIRKPIRRLREGMVTISDGNLDAKIELTSDTEIGDLANAFNAMAADVKKARDESQEWARTLEERIAAKSDELQRVQNQVIHMEKMASLGKLSASVAHEINNPLFGILTYAKLLLRELDERGIDTQRDGTIRDYLSAIKKESGRCGDIVKSLLSFARQTGGEFGPHHLNEIVGQRLFLLAHHMEMQQITLVKDLMDGDDELICDDKQLGQAIVAPCINAAEAMPGGGVLTVKTRGDVDTVSLSVTDTGIGIPEELVGRIFEPFFTTKEKDALGLGLAVVYGIVRRHQGKIDVDSAPGKGTTITITLPRRPNVDLAEEEGGVRLDEDVGPLTAASFPATKPGA